MKNFKKIASAIAALSLAACVAVPMSATVFTASATGSIQITNESKVVHTYNAYQIFDGDLDTTGVLSNIVWGIGIDSAKTEALINAIKELQVGTGKPFSGVTDAASIAKVLSDEAEKGSGAEDLEIAKAFATFINSYLTAQPTKSVSAKDAGANTYTLSELDDGYYLVKDEESSLKTEDDEAVDDAYTRFILKVAGTVTNLSVKSAKPSVDKKVQDEVADKETGADTEGFGETADHEIGEKFQFKLIANMPKSAELDAYKAYTLKFTDTMAKGVTYEKIDSVKIYVKGSEEDDETAITLDEYDESTNKSGYNNNIASAKLTAEGTDGVSAGYSKGDGTTAWELVIPDLVEGLKKAEGKNYKLSDIQRVEVVYDAHLNAEALVANTNVTATDAGLYSKGYSEGRKVNTNDVFLEYSNNPNKGNWDFTGEGDSDTGKTTPDTVGVFTYQVNNTKVDQDDKALPGAGFKLYKEVGGSKYYANFTGGTDGTYTFNGWATEANTGGTQMESFTGTGVFNFKGLDAGTYKLEETKTPDGYNALGKDVEIKIVAEHSEANNVGANLTLTKNKGEGGSSYDENDGITSLTGTIKNQKGASLPSTGGIGTTLFYLGGGALVAVAGVMLTTKKRMTKE